MKLVSYYNDEEVDQLAILVDNIAYDTGSLDKSLAYNMGDFLWDGEEAMTLAKKYELQIKDGKIDKAKGKAVEDLELLSPVPFPTSTRDAYAFRQHVAAARKNRGVEMIRI